MAIRDPYIDVELGNAKFQKINALYQYDHGLKLRISGLEASRAFSVHYAHIGQKEAQSVTPTRSGDFYIADIPDVLLFQDKELQCYVYVEEDNSGVTVYEVDMPIMPRAKPADSSYTPQQISNYDALVDQMNQLITETQALRDGLDDITDDAIEATQGAEDITQKLLNAQATVEMLDPGDDPVATVTQTTTHTLFAFQIPKSDVAYATFEVNQEDGCLYMYNPENFTNIDFALNDDGELCIEI